MDVNRLRLGGSSLPAGGSGSAAALRSGEVDEWDSKLAAVASPAPLTQSWAWGVVQKAVGWTPVRLLVDGETPVLVLTQRSGPFRWGYVPRGPVVFTPRVLEALIEWSRNANLVRLRVEPEQGLEINRLLTTLGFERTADVQPSHTRIVPLGPHDEMLASFRRTTRYNISYAERNHVTVDEGDEAGELACHVASSAARNHVNLPGYKYFKLLLEQLPSSRTFVARHDGESLCAALVAVHDRRGYYLYSGSSGHKRNLKAMDLTMWRAIQFVAGAGARDYDLWGIAPGADPKDPWHGFSEFKRGYGGRTVEYTGTWDLPLSPARSMALEAWDRSLRAYRRIRSASKTAA